MTVFQPSVRLQSVAIDPRQRVNYTLGMVLGVDDFIQESTWHSATLRQVVRDLIGYGTVRGLKVGQRTTGDGPEVWVAPGVAIVPGGELARVASEQCALLNEWLESGGETDQDKQRLHREAVEDAVTFGSPLDLANLRVYVVLDYAQCTTTPRPIPGEPCRSEDDVLVDSRIKDSFALSLQLRAPQRIEDQGVDGLLRWLAQIPIVDVPETSGQRAMFLSSLRSAALSAPVGPPFLNAPPPNNLAFPRRALAEWLHDALRVYVTELRSHPAWLAPGQTAIGDPPSRPQDATASPSGLLLAELDIQLVRTTSNVGPVWVVSSDPGAVAIEEQRRPTLLASSFTQAFLLRSAAALGAAAASVVAAGVVAVVASTGPLPASNRGVLAQEQGDGIVRVLFRAVPGVDYMLQVTPIAALATSVAVVSGPTLITAASDTARGLTAFTLAVSQAGPLPTAQLLNLRLMVQVSALTPNAVAI